MPSILYFCTEIKIAQYPLSESCEIHKHENIKDTIMKSQILKYNYSAIHNFLNTFLMGNSN